MARRWEKVRLLLPGDERPQEAEVELLVCNRCGVKAVPQAAPTLAWVAVRSDGRGGQHLDFCGPEHAADYFRELTPPARRADRPLVDSFTDLTDRNDVSAPTPMPSRNGYHIA